MKKLWDKLTELADEGGSLFVIIAFFSIFLIGIPYLIYKTGYLMDVLLIVGGVTFGILALFILFIILGLLRRLYIYIHLKNKIKKRNKDK